MDWIEEIVQKWEEHFRESSLKKYILFTMIIYAAGAITFYAMTKSICVGWLDIIKARYRAYMIVSYAKVNSNQITMLEFLFHFLYRYGLGIDILIAEYIGIMRCLKHRIQPGLTAAKNEIAYLSLGDYSHESSYRDKDEIGAVCVEVERLREQMIATKHEEWKLQAEQSSINAAFAHDMRTPLTVMRGYTEFLMKYIPQDKVSKEKMLHTLQIIHDNQDRLLEFSKTMTIIQTMEMRTLHCKWVLPSDVIKEIKQSAAALEHQSKIPIMVTESQGLSDKKMELSVDLALIMEVCENLLMNALRYAESKIELTIALTGDKLMLYVKDDGKGFSVKALKEAKMLYYSEEKGVSNHFGMGLYLCDKLCKKHGGNLSLVNGVNGGAITAAEFRVLVTQGMKDTEKIDEVENL